MASRSENRDKQRTPARGTAKSPAKPAASGAAKSGGSPSRAKAGSSSRAAAKTASTSRSAAKAAGGSRPAAKADAPSRSAARSARSEGRDKPVARDVKSEDKVSSDGSGTGMNREMKRMMQKREGAADRLKRPTVPKAKRTKPLTFLKEVRGELGRVAWPTRQEVITYSLVVVVTVTFFMVVIYGIDYVALKGVLFLIERGGR